MNDAGVLAGGEEEEKKEDEEDVRKMKHKCADGVRQQKEKRMSGRENGRKTTIRDKEKEKEKKD